MEDQEPKILYEGRHLLLLSERGWEYAKRAKAHGVVAMVALTPDNTVLFVEQYRVPVKKRVIEFPAGLAGDLEGQEEESLELAAIRELEEETGWKAARMTLLVAGPVSSGSSTSVLSLFMAHDLVKTGEGGGDDHEDIEVHEVPLSEVETWISEQESMGKAVDPKVFAGLYFLIKQK